MRPFPPPRPGVVRLPRGTWLAIALTLADIFGPSAIAAQGYTVRQLPSAPPGLDELFPSNLGNGLSNAGHVVASGAIGGVGYFYRAAVTGSNGAPAFTAVGPLPGASETAETLGKGVSDDGRVTGSAIDAAGRGVMFYADPGAGVLHGIVSPYGYGSAAYGQDVNTAGRVVGYTAGGARGFRALATQPDGGSVSDLGTLGGQEAIAYSINNADRIVGWANDAAGAHRAAYWVPDAGSATGYADAQAIPGLDSPYSSAYAISESGGASGEVAVGTRSAAFYWSGLVGQPAVTLPFFADYVGDAGAYGNGVTSFGTVVGLQWGRLAGGAVRVTPFLWEASAGLRSLDAVVGGGWSFTDVRGVNERGQILAYGRGPEPNAHAAWVLVAPPATVPEPEGIALVGSGLVLIGWSVRRMRADCGA